MSAREGFCVEEVGDPPGYWHFHQCERRVKVLATKNGETVGLCKQHAKLYKYREHEQREAVSGD